MAKTQIDKFKQEGYAEVIGSWLEEAKEKSRTPLPPPPPARGGLLRDEIE